jgi:hypothetical protein
MKFRKKLIFIGTILLVVVILLYAFFNARLLIAGPEIIIKSPENGLSFDTPFIEIVGEARNTSFISMNGNTVYINEENEFREKLLLPPGTSIIKIDARDRFERSTEVLLWYTYKGSTNEIIVPEVVIDLSTTSATTSPSNSSSSPSID